MASSDMGLLLGPKHPRRQDQCGEQNGDDEARGGLDQWDSFGHHDRHQLSRRTAGHPACACGRMLCMRVIGS